LKVYNFAENLVRSVEKWREPPSLRDFEENYYNPMANLVEEAIGTAEEMHSLLPGLDWETYRERILKLDPAREEKRFRDNLAAVENLFGFQLEGETVLFGSLEAMDGYARFDKGSHRVFLGIDESFDQGNYLDILEVHELTHVARESRPEVWTGWGFNPKMSHQEFTQNQPSIEHVFGEGFSCTVSELLVRSDQHWDYAYQSREGLFQVLKNGASVDKVIHQNIGQSLEQAHDGNWGILYSPMSYQPRLPMFTHYVWGWKWTRQLLQDRGGDPKELVRVCSKEFFDHARNFKLGLLTG
jgi:hypothetical protein